MNVDELQTAIMCRVKGQTRGQTTAIDSLLLRGIYTLTSGLIVHLRCHRVDIS